MQMHSTSSLPLELWKKVLTYTSQADRARCSLVSKAFQAAAVAAMETVGVSRGGQARMNSLQSWLDNHGQYVKRLQVWSSPGYATLALLACQHLQQLQLERIEVLVVSVPNSLNSNRPGHNGALTALTNLYLSNCTVAGGLVGLSVLTALKTLKMSNTSRSSQPCFPGSVFQHYRLLTYLELDVEAVTDLHFVSCLVSLQQLTDCMYGNPSIPTITHDLLPGGLPASLRVLKLRPAVLDPVVLLGLTNLRDLQLAGLTSNFELAGGSAVQLLAAIAAMQQLEELHLWNIRCDWPPPSSAAYSSLTASSNLTCLDLEDCHLPVGASARMFIPSETLDDFAMFDRDTGSIILPWQSAYVERLVMHCPELRSIGLGLQSSVELAMLTRLSALTSLDARFAGEPIGDGAFIPGEPGGSIIDTALKFTELKELRLSIAAPVDMATVLPLTALRQLTALEVKAWIDNPDDWENIDLDSFARPPLVWLKLLKLCAEDPGCHTIIMQQLLDQQAQLQQQEQQQATVLASALSSAAAAQDEAAAARAEAAAARAQASAAETAANAAEAAANAARADAAALRDQLAALQAAVQHLLHPQATE